MSTSPRGVGSGRTRPPSALERGEIRWATTWYSIQADLYRVSGSVGMVALLRRFAASRSTRFLVALRLARWARTHPVWSPARIASRWAHRRWTIRYGYEIPVLTEVGPGLKLSHLVGGIIVNQHARIGQSVTLTPGVVIGNNAGSAACPTIGDEVVVHVGAKVIGEVTVGRGTQVGAGAVVVKDVPPRSVVAGVPAKVLSGRKPASRDLMDFERVLGPVPDRT